MSWFSGLGDALGGLFGGAKSFLGNTLGSFGQAAGGGLSNLFRSGANAGGMGLGGGASSFGSNPFSGSSQGFGNQLSNMSRGSNFGGGMLPFGAPVGHGYNVGFGGYHPTQSNPSGGGFFGNMNRLLGQGGNFAKAHPFMTGLAGMFGSNMMGNPKMPPLPGSFYDYQRLAQGGGPEISRTGANALTGVLNTPFSQVSGDEEAAATHALDLNYQEQLRQLQGMYKSLRPGTDPTTDTTYRRDLGLLNDQYAREKAQTTAQLHRQAYNDYFGRQIQGSGMAGQLGGENMDQQAAAVATEVSRQNAMWQADVMKREALRNQLMGLGSFGALGGLFPNMFG